MSSKLKDTRRSQRLTVCRWDDWVPQDRVRKFTPENQELARQLHGQMKALQGGSRGQKAGTKKGGVRANGSDFSSARGSEERHASVAAPGGRGPRRQRDFEIEPVSPFYFVACLPVFTFSWGESGSAILPTLEEKLRHLLNFTSTGNHSKLSFRNFQD
jgi:hypothetical protein